MAVNLGSGVVRIAADLAPFRTALVSARYQLASFVAGTRSLGQVAGFLTGNFLVAGLITLTRAFVDANMSAAHLGETMNRVNVIFGESASVITGFANEMSKKFGYAKIEVLELSAAFGQMALGAGLSQKEAAEFANVLSQAAIDAQSFMDVDLATAGNKIASGLAGQIRPLREWGALMSAAQVKEEAYRLGLAKTGAKLTERDKVLASSTLILKKLGVVEGDAQRTAGSTMRQTDAAIGNLKNAFVDFGEAVSPLWTSFVQSFNRKMISLRGFIDDNKEAITAWSFRMVDAFKMTGEAISRTFGAVWTAMFDARQQLRQFFSEYKSYVTHMIRFWKEISEPLAPLFKIALQVALDDVKRIFNVIRDVMNALAELEETRKIFYSGFEKGQYVKDRDAELAKPAQAADIARVMAQADAGAKRAAVGEDVPSAKGAKQSTLTSFEQFWEKLQGGAGVEQKQLNQLVVLGGKMDNIVNAVKNQKANAAAVPAGGH